MDLKRYRPTTKGKSIHMRKYQENLTQRYGPWNARKMLWSFTLSFLPPERFCAWSRNFRVRRLLHVSGFGSILIRQFLTPILLSFCFTHCSPCKHDCCNSLTIVEHTLGFSKELLAIIERWGN